MHQRAHVELADVAVELGRGQAVGADLQARACVASTRVAASPRTSLTAKAPGRRMGLLATETWAVACEAPAAQPVRCRRKRRAGAYLTSALFGSTAAAMRSAGQPSSNGGSGAATAPHISGSQSAKAVSWPSSCCAVAREGAPVAEWRPSYLVVAETKWHDALGAQLLQAGIEIDGGLHEDTRIPVKAAVGPEGAARGRHLVEERIAGVAQAEHAKLDVLEQVGGVVVLAQPLRTRAEPRACMSVMSSKNRDRIGP
jgi:hypothetical protein